METITNISNSASEAIWGKKQTEEPISGETGTTSYDAGNDEENTTTGTNSTTQRTMGSDDTTTGPSASTAQGGVPQGSNVTGDTPSGNTAAERRGVPSSSNDTSGSAVEPSVGAVPTGDEGRDQHQGGDAPMTSEDPTKGDGPDEKDIDTSGPGPKPLSEVGGPKGREEKTSEDGPDSTSHGEGTGEQYVKSSGMAAEGGDFDASNPGAGKEADRLLDEKGVHRADAPTATTDEGDKSSSSIPGEEKKSVGSKIKDKLHIGKKDKA